MALYLKTADGIIPVGGDGSYMSVTPWMPLPTYGAQWSNYGGGWETGQYRKVGDIVELRGLVQRGSSAPSATLCTLPVGFRPAGGQIFTCMGYALANNWGIRMDVLANGNVNLDISNTYGGASLGTNALSYLDLSGIRFSVTPTPFYPAYSEIPIQPRIIGIAKRTTNSPAFTASSADISGLSVTFNAEAGRRYKATAEFEIVQGTASDIWVVGINEGGTVLKRITGNNAQASASITHSGFYTNESSISGAKTWKVTALAAVGTGVVMVAGSGAGNHYTSPPATLMIEDIGAL